MSEFSRERKPASVWFAPSLTWAALMALLALNVALAFLVPHGLVRTAANLGVALVQAALLWLFFMRLDKASSLVRLTACAAVLWLSFLFIFAGADYFTRP